MMIMKILDKLLNEEHTQSANLAVREGFVKIKSPVSCHIEMTGIGINKMHDNLVVVHAHPHLDISLTRWIILYHIREELLHGKVQHVAHLVIDLMSESKLVRKIENPVERINGSCEGLFHSLRVHACIFFRSS